jgi:hypothetical protein
MEPVERVIEEMENVRVCRLHRRIIPFYLDLNHFFIKGQIVGNDAITG